MKKYTKRYLALILTFAMVLTVPFAFSVQEANAATKNKTRYVLTKSTTVTKYDDGSKPQKYWDEYAYKNGLVTAITYGDDDGGETKETITRNSKGYATKILNYKANGKLSSTETYTYKYNKKGLPVTEKCYIKKGKKKKTLDYTKTYTYHSNKKIKKEVTKRKGYKSVTEYRKDGTLKRIIYTDKDSKSTLTYNKHGYVIKNISQNTKTKESWEYTTTYKYNKNGDPVKSVTNSVDIIDGKKYKSKSVTTAKYTYDSHKNITKVENKITDTSDGNTSTITSTTTYTYKKVKVPKKYWHFFK